MDIFNILPRSLLGERLEALAYLYRRSDSAVAEFSELSGVACPAGCGTCCEAFVPDIVPLEAAYLAAYLARADRSLAYSIAANGIEARTRDDGRVGCPLYADGTPYHCTVYEARPLICRMFAFSATRDKLGAPTFAVCRKGTSLGGVRSAKGDALIEAFGVVPPVMADIGSELASIEPESSGLRKPLPAALRDALSRVLFLVGMPDSDSVDGGPDVQPTLPRAG